MRKITPYIRKKYRQLTAEKVLKHLTILGGLYKSYLVRTDYLKDSVLQSDKRHLMKVLQDIDRIKKDGFTIEDVIRYYG